MSRTAIATIATLLALAAPASAALDPITLLSGSSATSGGDDYTFAAEASDGSEAITPDGRYIAFATLATNVATGLPDTNTSSDIIWEDLQTGQVKLVSVNAAGTAAANAVSVRPAISDDGRYVAFESTATNLVTSFVDGNGSFEDVYVRDMQSAATTLISHTTGSATTGGNGRSVYPILSGNGHRVIWWGKSSNTETPDVRSGGPLTHYHLFARDLTGSTIQVVDVNAAGTDFSNADAGYYAVSTDGRYVAFISESSDLVNGFTNPDSGVDSVYRRDLQAGTTVLASPSAAGPAISANGTSDDEWPAISDDGNYITFQSGATNLIAGFTDNDTGSGDDIFQRDLGAATTTLVSAKTPTSTGDDASYRPRQTPDGRYVLFLTRAGDVIPGDTNGHEDLLRWDRTTGAKVLIDRAAASSAPATGGTHVDNSPFGNNGGAMSDDGRYVAFSSDDPGLVAGATAGGHVQVYLRDVTGAVTQLISGAGGSATVGGNNDSNAPWISGQGTRVTFASIATDLVAGFTKHNFASATDLFARGTGVAPIVVDTGGGSDGGGPEVVPPVTGGDPPPSGGTPPGTGTPPGGGLVPPDPKPNPPKKAGKCKKGKHRVGHKCVKNKPKKHKKPGKHKGRQKTHGKAKH